MSGDPPPRTSLIGLPPDILPVCLSFLPPNGIRGVSHVLSTSRAFTSAGEKGSVPGCADNQRESSERAAWLVLREAARRSGQQQREQASRDGNDGVSMERAKSDAKTFHGVTRYRNETWLALYSLVHHIAIDDDHSRSDNIYLDNNDNNPRLEQMSTESEVEPPGDGNDDFDESYGMSSDVGARMNTPRSLDRTMVAMWLLFDVPLPRATTTEDMTTKQRVATNLVASATKRECSQARIVHAALRLGDEGMWNVASDLLSASASGFPSTSMSTDAKVFTCNFIIDRMYAQTYVRHESGQDSADLGRAVQFGRMAVEEALRACRMAEESAASEQAAIHESLPPEPIASLFESDETRLFEARLALARALGLLAQHVGLSATDPFETEEVRSLLDDENVEVNHGSDAALIAESFFLEALNIIERVSSDLSVREKKEYHSLEQSYAALDALRAQMQDVKDDKSQLRLIEEDIVQMEQIEAASNKHLKTLDRCLAAVSYSKAVEGEIFYCAASVNTVSSGPVLAMGQGTRAGIVYRHVRRSIWRLRFAIEHAFKTVIKANRICVEAIMGSQRSLILLFARAAKDLGKVYCFAHDMGLLSVWVQGDVQDSLYFFEFALALMSRLYRSEHPALRNIRVLAGRLHGDVGFNAIEDRVDLWLSRYEFNYYNRDPSEAL